MTKEKNVVITNNGNIFFYTNHCIAFYRINDTILINTVLLNL